MKRIYLLIVLFTISLSSWSQLLVEHFPYTPDPVLGLGAQSGGNWLIINTGDSILVDAGSLSYTGLAASTGNKVIFEGAGTDYYTEFPSQTSGSIYSSFILNVSALGGLNTTGGYFAGLIQSGSTSLFGAAVWTRLSTTAGKYNVGISTRSNSAVSWLAADLTPGTPCFIVTAYDINAGAGDDVCRIWLNTSAIGGAEPAADATSVPGTDLSSAARFFLRQAASSGTPFIEFDELRVGTTWSSVTPPAGAGPVLSATPLADFGDVCINTTVGPNTFTITGTNLTTANVTVGALTGFTYSTTSGGTYTTSLSLAQPGGAYSQDIYVKFTPTAVQSYNGNIPVGGGGATSINVAASGSGINAPLVTTGAASSITQVSATLAGTITATGCSAVTAYGVEYSTTIGFPNGTGTAVPSTNLSSGNFSSDLTGLSPATTYYYHAYATNGGGTGYGTEQSFTTTAPSVPGMVISQVYGGGGNASATYNQDFVELFNRSTSTIDISGWSIQYASATGPGGSGDWAVAAIPAATSVAPGKYYLIALATGATGVALPTPDLTNTGINMSATAGKVALVNNSTALNGTTACNAASVVDVIGYGTTASCSETAPFNPTGIDNTKASFRKTNGCTDDNNNSTDFEVLAVSPRNSATAANVCGAATPVLTATPLTAFGNVCINTTAGPNMFTITGTNLTAANVTVAALTGFTYSTTSGGTYTTSLSLTQPGGAYSQDIYVKFTPTAVQSYSGNIAVGGGGATSIDVAASGAGVNSAPTVTTGAASSITTSSATLAGSIPSIGCSAITAYGIEYSTTNGFPNGSGTQVPSSNLSGGNFSSNVSGLATGTTYYYKAYATNGGGTTYGTQQSFVTASATPVLTASSLTAFGNVCINTTAGPNMFTITGTALTAANVTVGALAGFTYSTTSGGTYTTSLSLTQPGGAYSQDIYVKFTPTAVQSYNGNIPVGGGGAASVNVAATGAGVNTAPTVTTGGASAITATTATLAGSIPSTGCSAITAYGVEYSTTSGFPNGTGTAVPASNLSGGNFSSNVSGLTASTTYYYHAYATNGGGTSYGTEQSFVTSSSTPTAGLVISQVYGNGGNSGATYNADFVELHNITTSPITMTGYSIQYGSAGTTGTWSGVAALPTATIQPGAYYLIQMSSTGATGVALPTPDAVASPTISMSGTAGRVALVNGTTALVACPASTSYVDLVGYGTTVICFEGSGPAGAHAATTASFRKTNGCTQTHDNANDFEVLTVAPRNSASPVAVCGAVTPVLSATALSAFGNVCINTTAGPNSFTITGTNLTNANITVGPLAGFTFSTTSGGTYTASLNLTQAGGSYSQQVFVKFTPTTVQSYNGNIAITGGGAPSIDVAASGAGINSIPTVTTGAASAITSVSATLAGSIPATGCTAVTAYGVEYSTTNGFPNGTGTAVPATNLAGGNFSSNVTGLTPGITYYYHAYATNAAGTGYGVQQSFTTIATTPVLTVTSLNVFGNICINTTAGPNSFTVNGTNLTNANITVGPLTGFSFSTTSGGTYTASLTLTQPGGNYSQQVFVRFSPVAVQSYNGNIPVTGAGAPATSAAASGAGVNTAPSVTSGAASAITQVSATVAGTIPSIGCSAITAYGIEYSTTNGFPNGSGTQVPSTNLSGANFSSALTGLAPSTVYYYKAYATNGGGTGYGAQLSFTTSAPVLTATPLTAFGASCINSSTGPNSFTINSTVVTAANITVGPLAGYTFSTTPGGTYTASLSLTHAAGPYTQTIYVKFTPTAVQSYNGNIPVGGGGAATINVAASGSGVNTTATVVTGNATALSPTTVTLEGSVSSIGCSPVTSYGIEYSGISGLPNGLGTKVSSSNLSGANFSSSLSGLVQGSTYYYKAWVTNSGGTTYGAEKTFTLPKIPGGFVIYSVPVRRGTNMHYSYSSIKPGHYEIQIFNSVGQLVYQREIITQWNFIDDNFILPGKLGIGTYSLHIVSPDFRDKKRFMIW